MSDPEPHPGGTPEVTRATGLPTPGGTNAVPSSPERAEPPTVPGEQEAAPDPIGRSETVSRAPETGEHRATAPHLGGGGRPDGPGRALPVIPGYEILGELGRGSMGVVYRARHRRLHRTCALKMILAGSHAAPESLVRFLAEAESVARLQHPHIVAIHHIGEHEQLPFIELEYLGGGSLADRLDGTPRPPRRAAGLIATLAGAIQAAHEAGVVHRDLKPANILLDDHESPKVADFGVAKALGSDTGLTATDSILGSPSYMAPEQAVGHSREVGPAADVYALGAILYELLTGRPPFRGATVLETLEQVKATDPVPPSRLVPGLPRDVETIALKCLQKEPQKRYAAASALAEDLGHFLAGEPIVARPVPSWERLVKWCRRRPAVAAMVAALHLLLASLLVLGLWSDWQIRASREELRRQNAVARIKLALREFEAANIEVARDHLDDCPEDLRGLEWRLVDRLLDRERETFDDHEWHVWDVAYSPDGRRIASVSGGWIYATSAPGRGRLLIRDADTGSVVFEKPGLRHGLYAVAFDPNSGGRSIATGGGLQHSPDGSLELQVIEGRIDVWDTQTSERRTLDIVDGQNVLDLAYSPDGSVLAAAYGLDVSDTHRGYARLWDVATGEPLGEPFEGRPGGVSAVAFSPDGRLLALAAGFSEEGRNQIEIWDVSAQKPELEHCLSGESKLVHSLAFDPSGRFLASAEMGTYLVRLWDVTTGSQVQVFKGHESFVQDVAFSPDGRLLASCAEDHLVKLWDVETAREVETLRGHPGFVLGVAFDPGGNRLVSGDVRGSVKLWDVEPGKPLRLETDGWARRLAFHPDGKRLVTAAAQYSQEHAPQLWDLDTGRLVHSFPGHERGSLSVALSSGDGALLASGGADYVARIWDLETGRQLPVLDHGGQYFIFDVTFHPRDRTRIAAASGDGTVHLWTIDPSGRTPPEATLVARLGVQIQALAFRPPLGRYLAAGTEDGVVHVLDLEEREEVFAVPGLGEWVIDLAYSPDGVLLATANKASDFEPGSATLLDAETGRVLKTLPHPATVRGVAFHPDGTRLATACDDRTVKLWDLATWQDVLTLRGHKAGVLSVAFDPEGRRLASGSIDHTVLVWDTSPVSPALDR
ncbi:WD40 repeat domain-containing serine/threonine protein kinase [Tautonia plasticadhaerens]|uniref:non-specific serine/threonine protein kinase n=1 Tax=Tautonia plasticadhaerens TaxID=2527974 RepID=A0A518HDR1_9BACT|nr:protein kinase [Tautonia plasticadhaerens]QDV38998.1 Serine/threonine-protein kinase PknB [Tautonia plasticadhaerens]